jgi:hypothetical protein
MTIQANDLPSQDKIERRVEYYWETVLYGLTTLSPLIVLTLILISLPLFVMGVVFRVFRWCGKALVSLVPSRIFDFFYLFVVYQSQYMYGVKLMPQVRERQANLSEFGD